MQVSDQFIYSSEAVSTSVGIAFFIVTLVYFGFREACLCGAIITFTLMSIPFITKVTIEGYRVTLVVLIVYALATAGTFFA